MDLRFLKKIIGNFNAESFLPENIPTNLINTILDTENKTLSDILVGHFLTLLYNHYNAEKLIEVPQGIMMRKAEYRDLVRLYKALLSQERKFRLGEIHIKILPEIKNVLKEF